MLIAFFSDTHGRHGFIPGNYEAFGNADTVVFSGDFSPGRGRLVHDFENFATWFSKMPVKFKICIAGNHDHFFEDSTKDELNRALVKFPELIYLNDSGITLDGIKFWGSPITPFFHAWAFNKFPGIDIAKHWEMIPDGLNRPDVLITHGPPNGILDKLNRPNVDGSWHPGCPSLLRHILYRVKPQISCFGHIHEGYGQMELDGITFINASTVNEDYRPINPPIFKEIISKEIY